MSSGSGSARQVEQIILQVQNMEALRQLQQIIEEDRLELLYLRQEYDDGRMAGQEYSRVSTIVGQRMAENTAAANKLNRAVQQAAASMRDWRMNLMGLGYAMNDFFSVSGNVQQRLNAIANNLPMLLAGFGGIGIALSALAPVIGMVIGNWDNLRTMMTGVESDASKTIEGMKKKLEELEKKPVKVAVDYMEIEGLKNAIKEAGEAFKEYERLKGLPSGEEREAAAGAKAALESSLGMRMEDGKMKMGEIGAPEIMKRLVASITQAGGQFEKTFAPLQQALRKLEGNNEQMQVHIRARDNAIKDGDTMVAESIQESIDALGERGKLIEKEVAQAKGMVNHEATAQLDKWMQEAQTAGPKQKNALEQLARVAGEARDNELLWLKEQLQQTTVAAVQARQVQQAKGQAQERKRKTELDLAKQDMDFAMEEIKATQLDDARLTRIGIEARDPKAMRNFEQQRKYIQDAIAKIMEKGLDDRMVFAPEGAEMEFRGGIRAQARAMVQRVPGMARAGEKAERDRDSGIAQEAIDTQEARQLKARENIHKVLGDNYIADIHKEMADIERNRGTTDAQKRFQKQQLAQMVQQQALEAFQSSTMNVKEISNAMKELLPSMTRDYRDQLARIKAKMKSEQDAAQAAFAAQPQGGPPPVLPTPMQAEVEARRRLGAELGRAQQGGGGGGAFRSVAPQAQGGMELGMNAIERGNGIIAQTQGAMGGMLARISKVEADQRSLANQARQLQTAANEHQGPALNFGWNTA